MSRDPREITVLLNRWGDGDEEAFEELARRLYPELKKLAESHHRRERPGSTLQPTALVNEAYVRLVGQKSGGWKSRLQFFKVASKVMRNVLIDYFRAAKADKRGGGVPRVTFDERLGPRGEREIELDRLHDTLDALRRRNPLHSQIVELRFFGGLTVDEVALELGLNRAKVKREWSAAKAWLYEHLGQAS